MLNSLQAGRGLAAIAVLLFHLSSGIDTLTGVDVMPVATRFGYLGVDFFFVLSGFIMMLAHHRDIGRPDRWSRFAYKRFARIYPAYWIYTALVLVVMLAGVGTLGALPQSFADWFSSLSLIRVSDVVTPIAPGWTLFHEMMFYAAFSVLLINRRAGVILMAVWFAACAALSIFPPPNQYSPLTTPISAINLNFLFGMCAYWAFRNIHSATLAAAVALAGILLLIAAISFDGSGIAQATYLYGAGFAALIAGATNLENRRSIKIPLFTFLGNASYSIYLLHETGMTLTYHALVWAGLVTPYTMFALGGAGALLAGLAGYLLIEKPLLNRMRPRRTVPSRTNGPAPGGDQPPKVSPARP